MANFLRSEILTTIVEKIFFCDETLRMCWLTLEVSEIDISKVVFDKRSFTCRSFLELSVALRPVIEPINLSLIRLQLCE